MSHCLNPTEIAEAARIHGGRAVMAILTTQTCGEACWHAREEVCRCSCGGRNHGCLTHADGQRPERTAKIDGYRYRLKAVGKYADIVRDACEINRLAGYSSVDKPMKYGEGWMQYRYTWRTTDSGAPARLKTVSQSQRAWKELQGWHEERSVYLLWERLEMPERPTQPVVDKDTGLPLADQLPPTCHA